MNDETEYEYILRLHFASTESVNDIVIDEDEIDRYWDLITRAQVTSRGDMYEDAKILRRPRAEWEVVRALEV